MLPNPIRFLPPAEAGLAFFLSTFVAVMVIRVLVERRWYLTRWLTFRLGDAVALPLFAGFASAAIASNPLAVSNPFMQYVLLIVGMGTSLWLEIDALEEGHRPFVNAKLPSQLFHAVTFGIVFMWITDALLAVIVSPVTWQMIGAFIALVIYGLTVLIDFDKWEKLGPERLPRGGTGPDDPDR